MRKHRGKALDGSRQKYLSHSTFACAAASTVLLSLTSVAQESPPSTLPPPDPLPEVETLPPVDELLPPIAPPTESVPQPQLAVPGTIVVDQFEVVGSTVFSQTQLVSELERFTKQPITFTELLQAQEAITQLYVREGFITTGTFIPPQTLTDGIVRIEVVEGSIDTINVQGLKRLRKSYVRRRLRKGTRAPLKQSKLLESLQLLQLDPLIGRVSAELSAGNRPGANNLIVRVSETPAFGISFGLDNGRVPSVGSNRRSLEITHNNLAGLGDRLNIAYFNTNGSNALDNLSYRFPINADNGTVELSYRLIGSSVIEEPFDELDIDSTFQQYALTYRQPVVRTPGREVALGVTFDRQESDVNVLDNLIEGKTRIFALRFFQDYTQRSSQDVFSARSQFNVGVEGFQTALDGTVTDDEFFSWRGQAQYLRLLGKNTDILLRTDLQLADRSLIPIEQFSLGGASTVRGFRQDLLLSDNGFLASAEVRQTIARLPKFDATLQVAPFFDFGIAWNLGVTPVTPRQTLYSTGLGLRLNIGERFNARLDWGIPLVDVDADGTTVQEDGIHFSVQYTVRF